MSEFIGHKNVIDSFKARIKKGNLSHAHLIVGADGIGKSGLAKIFASEIIGCNVEKDNIDIIKFYPKKESFGVDEIRELISEVSKKPYEGDKKVLIIYKGNKMTTQAQNALLKTIEEPPKGVYIIVLCENLESILETIISRCQIYKLAPLSKDQIKNYISRFHITKEDVLKAAIAFSQGIPGKAEQFLVNEKIMRLRDIVIDIVDKANKGMLADLINIEKSLVEGYKDEKNIIFELITSFLRDIIVCKEIDDSTFIVNSDKINQIRQLSMDMSFNKLNKMIERIKEAQTNINSNTSLAVTIRVMLIGFMEG